MSEDVVSDAQWTRLTSFSDTFTCYSSALATWVAGEHERWERVVNPGLYLSVTEAGAGRFAFGHFPAGLRQTLGLSRTGADDPAAAVEGVLAELGRSGRVIVAGDGYRLPWHVAFERRHVPHWFVIVGGPADAARPALSASVACMISGAMCPQRLASSSACSLTHAASACEPLRPATSRA